MRLGVQNIDTLQAFWNHPEALLGLVDIIGHTLHGSTRVVHFPKWAPEIVIKISMEDVSSNVYEWETWQIVNDSEWPVREWLAPCLIVSDNFSVLVQARTQPITTEDIKQGRLPDKIPSWISDTKVENWGWLNDKIVCHDYGNNLFINSAHGKRMKKSNWWSPNEELQEVLF